MFSCMKTCNISSMSSLSWWQQWATLSRIWNCNVCRNVDKLKPYVSQPRSVTTFSTRQTGWQFFWTSVRRPLFVGRNVAFNWNELAMKQCIKLKTIRSNACLEEKPNFCFKLNLKKVSKQIPMQYYIVLNTVARNENFNILAHSLK